MALRRYAAVWGPWMGLKIYHFLPTCDLLAVSWVVLPKFLRVDRRRYMVVGVLRHGDLFEKGTYDG